jgi:hypothetical protein
MKKIFATLLLASSFIICFGAITDITGKWIGLLQPGDGNTIPFIYTFKASGSTFTGSITASTQTFPIIDGQIKGDSIKFNVSYNGNNIPNSGRLYTDSIGLDISLNNKVYHTVLKRQP